MMESTSSERISIFNADKLVTIFSDLRILSEDNPGETTSSAYEPQDGGKDGPGQPQEEPVIRQPWNEGGKLCSTCGISFELMELMRQHFKSDWHKFNLKQKLMNKPSVALETFEDIASGDVSSISGSESDGEDDMDPLSSSLPLSSVLSEQSVNSDKLQSRQHPKLFLLNGRGQAISLYRSVVSPAKHSWFSEAELVDSVVGLGSEAQRWAVLMSSGGHFAGAIFNREEVLVHKTFHRYTVRAKRGTAQGVRDSQQGGSQPKSLGASLRRYNEAALLQEVQDTLENWADQLNSCQRVFIRAPSYNKVFFYGGKKAPFKKDDLRVRTIPFATRRPTLKEVKRVHAQLTTLELYEKESLSINELFKSNRRKKLENKAIEQEDKQEVLDTLKTNPTADTNFSNDNDTRTVNEVIPVEDNSSESESETVSDVDSKDVAEKDTEISTSTKMIKEPERKTKERKEALPAVWREMYECCRRGDIEKLRGLLKECCERHHYSDSSVKEDVGTEAPDPPDSIVSCNNHNAADCVQGGASISAELGSEVDSSRQGEGSSQQLLNLLSEESGESLLHAAARSRKGMVPLLLSAGADPAHADKTGRVPFLVAGSKEIRNEFRRFMAANPQRFDYVKAKIPSPLTEEMERGRSQKDAEKKKAQKKAKKEKQKAQKEQERERDALEQERKAFEALSDREKRALAAEKRMTQNQATVNSSVGEGLRCAFCQRTLQGKVPFERLNMKYCSTECVREHKKTM